jgi:hypothetical protein
LRFFGIINLAMEPAEIKALRDKCEAEIEALLRQRTEIDQKILGLQTMAKGLDYMDKGAPGTPDNWKLDPVPLPSGLENLHSLGPTDAVRMILRDAARPLRPRQVRDRLEAFGYDKLPKDNPMAAVHGILKRLVVTGDVKDVVEDKKTAYRLVTPIEHMMHEAGRDITMMGAFGGLTRISPPPPAGGVPNPHGKTLGEMLKKPEKK